MTSNHHALYDLGYTRTTMDGTAEGTCEGIIAMEPRGEGGFGYDPLFYLPEYGKTFAELEPEIKNKISHRARALAGALDILSELERMKDEEE